MYGRNWQVTIFSDMKKSSIKSATIATCVTLCMLWALSASALSLLGGEKEEPLLEPDAAFQTRVTLDDNHLLKVDLDIAPGYFVYKSKIAVSSDKAEFGELNIPNGIVKQDEFFGEVETYRDTLSYSALITNTEVNGPLTVTVVSQGCADVGVCYPPYSKEFTVNTTPVGNSVRGTLAPLTQLSSTEVLQDSAVVTNNNSLANPLGIESANDAAPSSQVSSSPVSSATGDNPLSNIMALDTEDEVLDPEVAFTLDPATLNNGTAVFKWNIQNGHYLYKKRFDFELITPEAATVGTYSMPEGLWEEDAFFGQTEVFRGEVVAEVPISLPANSSEVTLKVRYQGCADIGICYPPITKEIKLVEIAAVANPVGSSIDTGNAIIPSGNATENASVVSASNKAISNAQQSVPVQAEQDRLADSLKNNNRWITIATFFGMGLLLTFTPCVLPMIPILSSIIVGNGDQISTRRAFTLSLVYVLAMALTYTIAGILVGLSGENIQATLQHPLVLSAFALLFVLLSLSMFGFYELQMPAFIQNRLSNISNKQKSGSFTGVATMGFLSALIVGPCVTAPLVGALIYIGQTGDAVLGGAALFALSMGMGLPLLIIGTTFGKFMPRAGAWMDITKAVFGVMLLGLAIYMLDRVIPAWATMLLSALLLITVSMFMGVFDSLPVDARGWRRVSKGFGFAALVYGVLLMIGVATGTGTLLRPIQGLSVAGGHAGGESTSTAAHPAFEKVKSIDDLNSRLAEAKARNTPVMFDFYADWCISCKEMEAFTFTDPAVAAKMNRGILLQADVTDNDEIDKALLKEFGIFGPPAIIFYDSNGVELKSSRVVGYMPADEFIAVLDRAF